VCSECLHCCLWHHALCPVRPWVEGITKSRPPCAQVPPHAGLSSGSAFDLGP